MNLFFWLQQKSMFLEVRGLSTLFKRPGLRTQSDRSQLRCFQDCYGIGNATKSQIKRGSK